MLIGCCPGARRAITRAPALPFSQTRWSTTLVQVTRSLATAAGPSRWPAAARCGPGPGGQAGEGQDVPLIVPDNLVHLSPPEPRPGPAALVVQRPARRHRQLAADVAGDGQQTLTGHDRSLRPGLGTAAERRSWSSRQALSHRPTRRFPGRPRCSLCTGIAAASEPASRPQERPCLGKPTDMSDRPEQCQQSMVLPGGPVATGRRGWCAQARAGSFQRISCQPGLPDGEAAPARPRARWRHPAWAGAPSGACPHRHTRASSTPIRPPRHRRAGG